MDEDKYRVRIIDLPPGINGLVRFDEDDFANIYINARASFETQRRTYEHEVAHILRGDIRSDRTIRDIEES